MNALPKFDPDEDSEKWLSREAVERLVRKHQEEPERFLNERDATADDVCMPERYFR